MAVEINCTSDLQCPEYYQLCYQQVSWDTRQGFCDCNFLFGWTGENCDTFGPATIAWITLDSFVLVATLVFLYFGAGISRAIVEDPVGRDLFILGGGLRTLISWFICQTFFVLVIGFMMFLLIEIGSPLAYGAVNATYLGDLEKQGTYTVGLLTFLSMMITMFMVNSLNLGVIWNELASKKYETSQPNNQSCVEFLGTFRGAFTASAAILFIATLVLLGLGRYELLGIVYAAAAVGLLILFSFGIGRYRKALLGFKGGDDRVDKLVVRTAKIFFPAIVGLVASVIVFAVVVTIGVKEFSPRDSISIVTVMLHVFLVCGWIMQVCIHYYLRSLLQLQIDTVLILTGAKQSKGYTSKSLQTEDDDESIATKL